MPGRVVERPSFLEELPSKVASIFEQVQGAAHNHRKNYVTLYKLHEEATKIVQPVKTRQGDGYNPIGEKEFQNVFFIQLGKVLSLKKTIHPADQVVKFVSGYVRLLNDKAAENRANNEDEEEDVLDMDSATTRFTETLVSFLLKGFGAKDKSVRYRVVQICAEIVLCLGEIDEDLYLRMRNGLLERLNDKEIGVRAQAATALCKFARTDDPEDVPEDTENGPPLLDSLLDALSHDPTADVRRVIVRNIPLTKATLSSLLERTRDTDTTIRRLIYSHVLDKNLGNTITLGDAHPSKFSIAQRELIVRHGLEDREEGVRGAASNLMVHWMDILGAAASEDEEEEDGQKQSQTSKERHLLEFLKKFDLSEEKVATLALRSIFDVKPEIFQALDFPPQYWSVLTPEKAFLARVFVDHCIENKAVALKEAALPEITGLAFRIQDTYNQILGIIDDEEDVFQALDDEARTRRDDERDACELSLEEMLKLAVNLDYSDEIGRRKMYALMRDILSQEKLPDKLIGRCLDVLRQLSSDEKDLIRIVVEVIQNLRDPGDEDEQPGDPDASFASVDETPKPAQKSRTDMTPEEQRRLDHINLISLILLERLLERVDSSLDHNSTLGGMFDEVIWPCVQHPTDPTLREKAAICFGLLSLISKPFGLMIPRFMPVIRHPDTPEEMRLHHLRILFDNLMVHQRAILKNDEEKTNFTRFFTEVLAETESETMQYIICAGLAKLAYSDILLNQEVIRNIIFAFFSPKSAANHRLLQFIEQFFGKFSTRSQKGQQLMLEVFIETFGNLSFEKASDDDNEMCTMLQIGQRFIDWTDPLKVKDAKGNPIGDMSIQVSMAIEILRELAKPHHVQERDDQRVLFQLLPSLYLPESVDEEKVKELKVMMDALKARKPPRDNTSKKSFAKFETSINKMYEEQLRDFNDEDWKNMQEHKAILDFVDSIIPEDEDEEPVKRSRKRRSPSVASTTTDGEGTSTRSRGKRQAKKRRISTSDDDESDWDDQQSERSATPRRESEAPTRKMPKRAATRKPIVDIQASLFDFEEIAAEATPRSHVRPRARGRSSDESNTTEPTDISAVGRDSIMDSDSEDEEDEVSGLLVED